MIKKAGYFLSNLYYNNEDGSTGILKCNSFILNDNEFGPIIFDTGSIHDSQALLNFLKTEFILTPEDIRWIFITHIHPDHIGANRFFKNAKIILSKKDYEFGCKIAETVFKDEDLLAFFNINCPGYKYSFNKFKADRMKSLVKKYWSEEIIGINNNTLYIEDNPKIPDFIKIMPTFGHTFHHYSYLLNINELKILVAGDAASMRMILRSNEEDRFLEPHMDFDMYFDSLNKIKRFDGIIVPGHDRPFFAHTYKPVRKKSFKINELIELAKT